MSVATLTERLVLRLPPDLRERLDARAALEDRPASWIARRALAEALAEPHPDRRDK